MSVISAASLNAAQTASLLGGTATGTTGLTGETSSSAAAVDLVALSSAALLERAEPVTGVEEPESRVELSDLSTTAIGQLLSYTQSGDVLSAMLGAPSGLNLLV